jgi:BirA family biotin operon repressor/biotin-[acetyl-CoA-carboxylase] ligase
VTERDGAARVSRAAFLSRQERFESIPSTNDVIREWLAEGTAEVCLAVAGEQTAGRGRGGRTWVAPKGTALLLSLGFRPAYLAPDRLWRLSAIVALAMADAAEDVAGLPARTLRLKWPNDIVAEVRGGAAGAGNAAAEGIGRPEGGGELRKVAGILGETAGAGTPDPRAVVGIGINADWPKSEFPAELAGTMTSLRELSGGRTVSAGDLLAAFLDRLEPRVLGLREGYFDVAGWHDRQITTGRKVRLEGTGAAAEEILAVGVDGATGALIVRAEDGAEREVLGGEISRVRLAGAGNRGGPTGKAGEGGDAAPGGVTP